MLAKDDMMRDLRRSLSTLQAYVRPGGKLNLLDINVQAEAFVAGLLNTIFGWDLQSANRARANFPCVDLVDENRKLGVQVTSEAGSAKLTRTIDCLGRNNLGGRITQLKVILLIQKQGQYTVNATCPGVSFDWKSDVLDFDDLLQAAQGISDLPHLGRVHRFVVNQMPRLFPEHHAPASQNEVLIRTHFGDVIPVNVSSCEWHGPARKPAWIETDPDRMSDSWIVAKFAARAALHLHFAPKWADGTYFVIDLASREGTVINLDQYRELKPTSPITTTTTTTPAHQPPLPVFKNGEVLRADAMNWLADAIRISAGRIGVTIDAIPSFYNGQPLTADALNALVNAVNRLLRADTPLPLFTPSQTLTSAAMNELVARIDQLQHL